MKIFIVCTLVLVLLTLDCNRPSRKSQKLQTKQILVKFKDTTTQAVIDSLADALDMKKGKQIPELNVQVFQLSSDMTLDEAIERCQQNPHVQYAEPDYQVRALEGQKKRE